MLYAYMEIHDIRQRRYREADDFSFQKYFFLVAQPVGVSVETWNVLQEIKF